MTDGDGLLSAEEVRKELNLGIPTLMALARSGLLGYHDEKGITRRAVESLKKYGTQWDREWGVRSFGKHPYQNMPEPPGIKGGEQPAGTRTVVQISAGVQPSESDNDKAWIVHLYLKPNRFFYPDPSAVTLVGPIGLSMEAPFNIEVTGHIAKMYPDEDGNLALIYVGGTGQPSARTIYEAEELVGPTLDALAVKYDQRLMIGIPSGVLTLELPKPPTAARLTPGGGAILNELRNAYSLYREGISSGQPFHQFLALWKSYESAGAVRAKRQRQTKSRDPGLKEERFPDVFAFGQYANLNFDKAYQRLNKPYRVAIAHGDVRGGKPRTLASAKDVEEVHGQLPIVRYMARTRIKLVERYFASG